jgi:uncharacterized SAM-dependent methyltransferase
MKKNKYLIDKFLASRRTYDKRNNTKYIWFDQPYHLYLEHDQAMSYLEMIEKDKFAHKLHQPIVNLVTKYADVIINSDLTKVSFYDLGPGLPTKTIPLLLEMKKRQVAFQYFPVDISKSFLDLSQQEVKKIGVDSVGIHSLFEELPKKILPKIDKEEVRIFQIGLTFNNYRPNSILKLLKTLMQPNDFSLIITEFYDKGKLESILTPYKDIYAENFNWLTLQLLGLDKSDFSYETCFKNQRIEMGFRPRKAIKFSGIELSINNIIVTAISYRYTEFSLTRNIQKHFRHFEMLKENQLSIYILKK